MRGNILLVDDNEAFVDSIKDILEDEGYQIQTALNGENALNISESMPFDVVLMDIKMPGMNGVECFLEMKQRNPDIRVIMFTAYAMTELMQQARAEGVCDILKKPLDMGDLVDTIEKAKSSEDEKYVLVADDDEALCDNLYEALSEIGYNVAVACDGRKAIEEAMTQKFDIMLVDMKMPGLNGLDVYREVKKAQPHIVTILMTGYAEEMKDLMEQGIQESAYTYLIKPIDIVQLTSLLKTICESQKALDQK